VSAEFWTEAAQMATAGLLVAMVAVPVGLLARALRPQGEPLLPRWKPWRVPWNGIEVLVAFFVVARFLPTLLFLTLDRAGYYHAIYGADFPPIDAKDEEANTLRLLWASAFALPPQLLLLWAAIRARYPNWAPALIGRGSFAGKVWLAVVAWLVLAPVVLIFNGAVNEVSKAFGTPPEAHPLTKLVNRPALDQALFIVEACIGAPMREEMLVRGLLLAWCVGRIGSAGVAPISAARPWFVMAVAVMIAVTNGNRAAIAFAASLAVGLGLLWRFKHTGARRARAVYATAAFFALLHPTWPNPVPLFVLGLGLGWLAVRTNGVLVPVLVHGLFNTVSAVSLLRGGSG
jgi:hypothetical protein